MAQKIWFTNDPVLMLNIDVEGDGKQVVTRPATEQDKANYSSQLSQMQGGGTGTTTQGGAGQPTASAQQSGTSGTTTRETQPAQPNQQSGAVGGQTP
jgi:hypothetical protein